MQAARNRFSGADPELRPFLAETRISAGADLVRQIDVHDQSIAERLEDLRIESLRAFEVGDGKSDVVEHGTVLHTLRQCLPDVVHSQRREARSDAPLHHELLQLGNGLGRAQALRAGFDAVHDRVTAVEPERILEIVEALAGGLIAGIDDPAIGLQQRGGAQ